MADYYSKLNNDLNNIVNRFELQKRMISLLPPVLSFKQIVVDYTNSSDGKDTRLFKHFFICATIDHTVCRKNSTKTEIINCIR